MRRPNPHCHPSMPPSPRLAHLAGPIIAQQMATLMLMLISSIFVGHMNSPVELSAVVRVAHPIHTRVSLPDIVASGGCPNPSSP